MSTFKWFGLNVVTLGIRRFCQLPSMRFFSTSPVCLLAQIKPTPTDKIKMLTSSTNIVKKYKWTHDWRTDKTRCSFPRPSETKRLLRHGWDYRMSTRSGRKILMNRILKGRHALSH